MQFMDMPLVPSETLNYSYNQIERVNSQNTIGNIGSAYTTGHNFHDQVKLQSQYEGALSNAESRIDKKTSMYETTSTLFRQLKNEQTELHKD